MSIYPVVLAGGVGTRFWPLSRRHSPKQTLSVIGEATMLQATCKRISGWVETPQIQIITTRAQEALIRAQLPDFAEATFIIEPFERNTAACVGLAAAHIYARDPDGVMVVLPADHMITLPEVLREVLRLAEEFVIQHDGLVTLGIKPDQPATGYGYIQAAEKVTSGGGYDIHRVKTFAEKPNLETAQRFLESGDFYWNSGIFIWKASTILDELGEHLPGHHEMLMNVIRNLNTPAYSEKLEDMYRRIRSISIDFGVMEHAENVFVIPADMGWRDIESWEIVHELSPKDRQQNVAHCQQMIQTRSRKNFVYSPDKLVALVGVDNLVVVDTGDALLICHKSSAQEVSGVVEELRKKGLDKWV